MDVRRLVRGTVEWDRLERVALELARRYDREQLRVSFLEADNWLSTPLVVDDEWFVKVISPQNALVHAVFTGARNLGAVSTGREGFFERYGTPLGMARHELEATRRMREVGVNAPAPVEAFEVDGLGVLVLEYLPEFRTLGEVSDEEVTARADDLFAALRTIHDEGLAHGDLRSENVLLQGEELYFIDATNVSEAGRADARSYDLASALAVLTPRMGPGAAVAAARERYPEGTLVSASEFLDVVSLRPDHDFEVAVLKGEIEKAVA